MKLHFSLPRALLLCKREAWEQRAATAAPHVLQVYYFDGLTHPCSAARRMNIVVGKYGRMFSARIPQRKSMVRNEDQTHTTKKKAAALHSATHREQAEQGSLRSE
jgi:hypothetical protein